MQNIECTPESLTKFELRSTMLPVRQGQRFLSKRKEAQEWLFFQKGSEVMAKMSKSELQVFLETLAKLVEATAKTPQEAAEIIREAKPK